MTPLPRGPLLVLLLAGCARPAVEAPPKTAASAKAKPPPKKKTPVAPLPGGFRVQGTPEITEPWLPPDATWRYLVSELRLLRAEGEDLLVSFEKGAFHATSRDGHRRTWRLPKGLSLGGVPAHVLLRADLGLEVARGDGLQVVGEEEVTVVTARMDMGGNVQEFRLVAKGGVGFRSISTGGEAG